MTRRSFTLIDVVEILVHWQAGRAKAESGRSLGIDRATSENTLPAQRRRASARAPTVRAEQSGRSSAWFPELVDPRARSLTHSVIAPFHPVIEEMLKTNAVTTVHERGLEASLTSFRRYVWLELPEQAQRGEVSVSRPAVSPGDEA